MSCSSASASTPMASASLARGLSSDVKSSVSPGSMSFRRNRSSVTRKGLANLRAVLIRVFISLLFMDSPHFLILHACMWATCQHRLDFVHHKGHSVAAPQPNFGISPAKALRPQSSEIKGGNVLPTFFTFPITLAPLRLGGKNIRFRLSSDRRSFAQAAKISKHSSTKVGIILTSKL